MTATQKTQGCMGGARTLLSQTEDFIQQGLTHTRIKSTTCMKSMKSHSDKGRVSSLHCFYGTATVGERGQIVIPAEAREELGFQAGDKLLVMKHPLHDGLMVFKIEAAQQFLAEVQASLEHLNNLDNKEVLAK